MFLKDEMNTGIDAVCAIVQVYVCVLCARKGQFIKITKNNIFSPLVVSNHELVLLIC